MSTLTFYEQWAALPRGTKFRLPGQPGGVFMKTSRGKGHKVVSLTDGSPNRLPNLVSPLEDFDLAVEVLDCGEVADAAEAGLQHIKDCDYDGAFKAVAILRAM